MTKAADETITNIAAALTRGDTNGVLAAIGLASIDAESGLALQEREREDSLQRLASLRKAASAEIDRLLSFLDASDEYVQTELEDDGEDEDDGTENEPSLGALDHPMNQTDAWTPYQGFAWMVDCEQDPSDDEPALGWHDDQHGFADMASRGPHEDEPSLGSAVNLDQRQWGTGPGNDYERQ